MKLEELLSKEFEQDSQKLSQSKKDFATSGETSLTAFSINAKKYQKHISDARNALLDEESKSCDLYQKRVAGEKEYNAKDQIYNEAKSLMAKGQFYKAWLEFNKIQGHRDATQLYKQCESTLESKYKEAAEHRQETRYAEAITLYEELCDYKDSKSLLRDTMDDKIAFPRRLERYNESIDNYNSGKLYVAYRGFYDLGNFKDSASYANLCDQKLLANYNDAMTLKNHKEFLKAASKFEELLSYKDSQAQAKACRKAHDDAIRAQVQEELRRREARKDAVLHVLFIIVSCVVFVPFVFSVVFGIILFTNTFQISVTASLFWRIVLWLLFTAASIVLALFAIGCMVDDEFEGAKAIGSIIAAVAISVGGGILGFRYTSQLQKHFDPAGDMVLSATSKETSYSYSTYTTRIHFTVENKGTVDVTYFEGSMKLSDESTGKQVASYTVYFQGDYYVGCFNNTYVDFDQSTKDLYSTDFVNLTITYEITSMRFANNKDKKIRKPVEKRIKSGSHLSYKTTNDSLSKVKSYAGTDAIFPDYYVKELSSESDVNYKSYYSYSYYNTYSAYKIIFEVKSGDYSSFTGSFISKLNEAGFAYYEYYYDHEYRKNNTAIAFSEVTSSSVWDQEEGAYRYCYHMTYWAYHFY